MVQSVENISCFGHSNCTFITSSSKAEITDDAMKVYPIFILTFGTSANCISFVIMRKKSLQRMSTSFYLCVLSVSDTLVLWSGLFFTLVQGRQQLLNFFLCSQSAQDVKFSDILYYSYHLSISPQKENLLSALQ